MAGKLYPDMGNYSNEDDFKKRFGDNHACIVWLATETYPNGIRCNKCNRITSHHYYPNYQSLQCDKCGDHYQPITKTIYQKKGIAIYKWFLSFFYYSKNQSINPLELANKIGTDLRTASYMLAKVRKNYTRDQ